MSSREELTTRSVLITGLPVNVNVWEFVNAYLSQIGIQTSAETVDYIGEPEESQGKRGYVVLLKSRIDARKILAEHLMAECRYQGGVSTISAVRCPEELIPEPWLEDPPRYNTALTPNIKEEGPPCNSNSPQPSEDIRTDEQKPLARHDPVHATVAPAQPQHTDVQTVSVTDQEIPSSPVSDFLIPSHAQTPPTSQKQITKSQQSEGDSQLSNNQDQSTSSQVSPGHGSNSPCQTPDSGYLTHLPIRDHPTAGQSSQLSPETPRIPQGPRLQQVEFTQNMYQGPARQMHPVGPRQNIQTGFPGIYPYPDTVQQYYNAPWNLPQNPQHPQHTQHLQHPQHTQNAQATGPPQYGNPGRFPQPDQNNYFPYPRGTYPPHQPHSTQGQLYQFPIQGEPYQNPTPGQPYQRPNQPQAYHHPPLQPYYQEPYPPTEQYPPGSYPGATQMHPQGSPSPHQLFGAHLQEQTYPSTIPSQQRSASEHPGPKPIQDSHKQDELKRREDCPTILEVKGIQPSTTEDSVKLYFENRRRSGGGEGEVVKVDMKKGKNKALVFFKDPETAERILKIKSHLINKQRVEVLAYTEPPCHTSAADDDDDDDDDDDEDDEDDDKQEQSTIEVRGFKPNTNPETLEFYFENTNRSGGGTVTGSERKDDVIFITFESPEVVQKVLKRKHKIDGANLTLKLHRPIPCYKNRFLVTGVSSTTNKENLQLFMEARAQGSIVTEVLYGEEPGKALVTFEDHNIPDFERVQQECRRRKLEGQHIMVHKVPVCDSVVVRGLKAECTEDIVQLYFENKRSGNTDGIPATASLHNGDGYCIVKFEDYRAIDKILRKQHTIDGAKLTVTVYMECLGLGSEDTDGSWYTQPKPFTVQNLDETKCRFLQTSKTDKEELKRRLKERHAEIIWVSVFSATMTCTLNKDAPNALKLAKSWHKDTEDYLKGFIDHFKTEECTTLEQMWGDVKKNLTDIAKSKSVLVFTSDAEHKVTVVGHAREVQQVGTKVKETVEGVENEFKRKQKEITEPIKTLKPLQLQLLMMDGYVADIEKRYPTDLNVTVDVEHNEIIFKGQVNEINECKVLMYERCTSYSSHRLTLSQGLVSFLDQKDVKAMVMNKLKDKKITGVWDIESKNETVIVMATTEENGAALGRTLKEMILEHHEPIDEENTSLLSSDKWAAFQKATVDRYGSLVSLNIDRKASHVVIVTFDNTINEIKEEVRNFILQNSVYRQIVKMPSPVYRFLCVYREGELIDISHDMVKHSGKLDYKSTPQQITVRGCQEALTKAVQDLTSLAKKVINKKYTLRKAGIGRFINSDIWKRGILSTEKESRCIIETSFDESVKVRVETIGIIPASVSSSPQGRNPTGTRVIASCDIDSKRRIDVVIGDITAMEVDVIVNAANNRLDHIGGLAKAIASKGGPTIQRESDEYTKKKALRAGDVVTTGAGRLPCKMVAHAVGPGWSGGHAGEERDLKDAIMLSIEKTDRHGYKSIALPALSAGIFRYPGNLATRHIVEAIKKFFTLESPNSGVRNVYLIDMNGKTTQLFAEALQLVFSDRRVALTQSNNTTDSRPPIATKPKPVTGGVRQKASSHSKVTIVKGEIAKQKADAIINSTSNNLDLNNGAVSKSILKAAGNTIQDELSVKYPQGIKPGDVAVSSGGDLGCRVYHACLSTASASSSDVLQNIILKCLQTASDDGCRTIAFPALGTGNLGYAPDFVAQTMYTVVNNFQERSTALEEVRVVIYPSDKQVIQAFEKYKRQMETGEITEPAVVVKDRRSFFEQVNTEDSWVSETESDGLQIGRLNVQIKQGDITKEDADCIVNSTNPELDLQRGAVSVAIATACGKDMTSQCKMKVYEMRQNGVVSTTAKGLKCNYVLHVAGEHFGNDWKKVVLTCLREADKLGDARSIALPVLGTGAGHVNPQKISEIMVHAFAEFEPQASNLTDVRVIVFQKSMFLTVSSQMKESVKSLNQKSTIRTPKTVPGVRGIVSEGPWSASAGSGSIQFGNITVQMKQGDITEEDTDCIVNSTNMELDLKKGAVSSAIRKACGKDMESQCAKKVDDMRQHGVISTTSKGLKCKYVLHVAGHHFGNDWKKVVLSCLEEAEKLRDAQSVAFPLLGTGIGNIQPEDIAKLMSQAFAEFGPQAVNISDVRVVVFQEAMLKPFAAMVKHSADTGGIQQAQSIITRGTTSTGRVDLFFFSDQSDNIANGIRNLEALCKEEWITETSQDQVITKLTDHQIDFLHKRFDKELRVDRNKGAIELTGLRGEVGLATGKVFQYLLDIEKEESETEKATLLSRTIQWAYFEKDSPSDKKDFGKKENAAIEEAFTDNKKSCKVPFMKTNIDIDFSSLEGTAAKKTYNVMRRDLLQEAKQSILDLPPSWQKMADDVNIECFQVAAGGEEFKTVEQTFMSTINNSNAKVLQVTRIQNRSLYQQYAAKRKQLEKQNPQGTQNEALLWHGTSTDAIGSINAHGFNRSYCGKNATAFGQGVYFAVNAHYSARDTYSRPDPQGQKYLYLVRVLTGVYTLGKPKMRVPPSKTGSTGTELYDSVVNDINKPGMYVVFNDTQAYPDYLVTFQP